MLSKFSSYALAAVSIFSYASGQAIPTATYTGPRNQLRYQGCFSDSQPLVDHGPWTFQTSGNCQPICLQLGKPVMGLVDGSNCFCGDLLPPADSRVGNEKCDTPCQGFDKENCGGNNFWSVYLTGLNKNRIDNFEPKSSSIVARPTAPLTSVVEVTIAPTIEVESSRTANASTGPNKAGIAAGVVAGVVILAGIIGGAFFYLKLRRRKQAEEDYRRQMAVKEFVGGGNPPGSSHSSLNDSRLDPEALTRRESVGSLADNQDYSRRILQVRNV